MRSSPNGARIREVKMPRWNVPQTAACVLVAASLFVVGGCSEKSAVATWPSAVSDGSTSLVPSGPGPNPRRADVELFEVCKDYVGGTGPAVNINVAVDIGNNGGIDFTDQISLAGGECRDVWVSSTPDLVTVTETVPAGFTASFVKSVITNSTIVTNPSAAGNSASGITSGGSGGNTPTGVLVIFTNTGTPPPGGGQGCTPGYWKQSHHFDSWPAPYTPSTQFSAVFENAFPGRTLHEVLSQGGGGLVALGRHTVAALLNAASSGVDYDLAVADVVSQFNGVFPGGNYNSLQNSLAQLNEQGCPLN
jgi:hypothetical protein